MIVSKCYNRAHNHLDPRMEASFFIRGGGRRRHSFPFPCKTTLHLPYLANCCTSRPARFSSGSQMQRLWMAVGGATSTRSTHGCGSLGAGGLAWGVCLCLRPSLRRGVRRSSGLGRRGVKRPAAAARQLGTEMNETHGPSTSGGISQDIPGYASL